MLFFYPSGRPIKIELRAIFWVSLTPLCPLFSQNYIRIMVPNYSVSKPKTPHLTPSRSLKLNDYRDYNAWKYVGMRQFHSTDR